MATSRRLLALAALALFALAARVAHVHAVVRVSCIGDSITEGACGAQAYPQRMQTLLGEAYVVQNFGVSGHTLLTNGMCGPPAAGNCSYVGTPAWLAALASQPDIVTIMLGTNDAKVFNWIGVQQRGDSYFDDYVRMIEAVQALPSQPTVVVLTLVPLFPPFPFQMMPDVINAEISAVPGGLVHRIAQKTGAVLFDLHGVFAAGGYDKSITCDGCHPTDAGYALIASALAPFVAELAANRTRV